MMKRKILSVMLVLGMMLSMMACGNKGEIQNAADEKETSKEEDVPKEEVVDGEQVESEYKVAFLTFTTEGDYWNYMFGLLEEDFAKAGAKMDIIDADGDAVRQVEQIENCVSQGYDLILELAVDPDAAADANKRAMEADVPVFQFIKDSGTGNRTSFRGTDETKVGSMLVDTTMEWVDEKFPDAEDGSVNVIIVGGNSAGSETERYDAMVAQASKYPKLNVVDAVRWETSQSYAQEATDNEITKFNGDVQVIIVGSGEMALGVRSSIMAEGSMITDYSNFGIFTVDISAESAESIRASANDEDVIRAACVNGGDTVINMQTMVDECMLILRGEPYEDSYAVDIAVATPDNLADFGY
ncbi:MAG: sugar ABC transporter substrate-binding protein [Lachnospiraceae bacterium]|nr:sugar ABC transporter substrate-binding protein [Lachnospiraceae bacterium]